MKRQLGFGQINSKSGQTLVLLLVFMAVTIIVVTAVTSISVTNYVGSSKFDQGNAVLSIAESGAENGVLRFLRDPTYTGEVLPVGAGSATITVTDGAAPTIKSVGTYGNFRRTIEVRTTFVNNVLTITSWKEI